MAQSPEPLYKHIAESPTFSPGKIIDPSLLAPFTAPEREWFVDDFIPHKTVTLLSGDGGLGKSLLMQQLATAAATGTDWLGMRVRKCRVFGLFCEDSPEELWRRQENICDAKFLDMEACYRINYLSGVGIDPVLMSFSGDMGRLSPLYHELTNQFKTFEPELIIIDTAADVFAGDEIKRSHVRNFINNCLNRWAQQFNATVILTSHPSRAGMSDGSGMSGSTAWNNSVRSRLYLTKPDNGGDTSTRILQVKKSNYGPTEHEIRLTWAQGVFRPTEGTPNKAGNRDASDEAAYLLCLRKLNERRQRPIIHANQANYAPKLMTREKEAVGISKQRLEKAQMRLFDKGVIGNIENTDGPPSKRKASIKIIDEQLAQVVIMAGF
jgi:RecA-family ATPase